MTIFILIAQYNIRKSNKYMLFEILINVNFA